MIDEPDMILQGLRHFRHNKHEIILFHIQDIKEIDFNFKRETQFIDSETGEKVTVSPWQIKKYYSQAYQENVEYLKNRCHKAHIEYNPITTNTSYEEILLNYLIKRSRLM